MEPDAAMLKRRAAEAALGQVADGMVLGLGSGSTAEAFVAALGAEGPETAGKAPSGVPARGPTGSAEGVGTAAGEGVEGGFSPRFPGATSLFMGRPTGTATGRYGVSSPALPRAEAGKNRGLRRRPHGFPERFAHSASPPRPRGPRAPDRCCRAGRTPPDLSRHNPQFFLLPCAGAERCHRPLASARPVFLDNRKAMNDIGLRLDLPRGAARDPARGPVKPPECFWPQPVGAAHLLCPKKLRR